MMLPTASAEMAKGEEWNAVRRGSFAVKSAVDRVQFACLPSRVRTDERAKVSSFSNSSPTSSHAAPKFGCRTFWMWSATVTSRSSSWGDVGNRSVLWQTGWEVHLSALPCLTYHILVVVSVVVGLSGVRVAVSYQVLHGAAERAGHWREWTAGLALSFSSGSTRASKWSTSRWTVHKMQVLIVELRLIVYS